VPAEFVWCGRLARTDVHSWAHRRRDAGATKHGWFHRLRDVGATNRNRHRRAQPQRSQNR